MEPVEEFLRDVEVLLALENSDFAAATQLVEELKDKSNETVKLLCRIQLCALELQIAYATGDLRRAHDVLYESPSCAQNVDLYGEKVVADRTSAVGVIHEFDGRMQLIDGKVSEALSTFLSAAQTYASCDSKRHAACKQLVIFCRLVRQAAGGQDFPSIESADDALLEKLVPLTAAIAKADIGAIRSVVDDPSFAELANSGMHDAISKWLTVLEDSNRFLTKGGQVLVDENDYWTLGQRLNEMKNPPELPTETWEVVLSMLTSEHESVQSACKKFPETFANIFDKPSAPAAKRQQ
ncbi:hypothetical protein AAVH_20848 [Aphelenchoides avenae]|nr:hypothetical protein AAVH_20848 [Aphelenchus avenae]